MYVYLIYNIFSMSNVCYKNISLMLRCLVFVFLRWYIESSIYLEIICNLFCEKLN